MVQGKERARHQRAFRTPLGAPPWKKKKKGTPVLGGADAFSGKKLAEKWKIRQLTSCKAPPLAAKLRQS